MLLRLLGWLFGYLTVEVTGRSVERFMNLCAVQKKDVWGFEVTSNGISMKVRLSDWKSLRSLAGKTHVKLHICKKHGLWFMMRPLWKRWGLVAGVCLFCFLLQFLSGRIWLIEIQGNQQVQPQEIKSILEQAGIREGINAKGADWATLRQGILSQNPEISWMSFNPQGSVLSVDISETTQKPQINNNEQPCNILASRDGRVVDIQVYTGKAMVKTGDAVVKGDMLISGAVEYSDGCTVLKQASGKVLAETVHKKEISIPFNQQVYLPNGEQSIRRVLYCFGLEIPLYLGSVKPPYEKETLEDMLTIKGVTLPLGFKKGVFYHTVETEITLTQEEAQNQGKEKIEEYIKENLGEAEIQNVEYEYVLHEDSVLVKSEIFCIENIIFHEKLLIF